MKTKTETLETRYRIDPHLLAVYKEKLLIPGWAGELDEVEYQYIRASLENNASLRRKWRVKKQLSFNRLQRIATNGVGRFQSAVLDRDKKAKGVR